MNEDSIFNYFRWALLDEEVFGLWAGTDSSTDPTDSAYADVVFQKAIEKAQNKNLAAETAVVMHIWMEISHHLYDALRACENGEDSAGTSIDRATALWIGEGQTRGAYNSGYLMYEIAQEAAQLFGYPASEAAVNKNILGFLVEAKLAGGHCSTSPSIAQRMRIVVLEILAEMTVPLLQKLIYHMYSGNQNHIELYSLAVIPQSIACGDVTYATLRDTLIRDDLNIDPNNLSEDFVNELKAFQRCLRITCTDIADRPITDPNLADFISQVCFDDAAAGAFDLAGYEGGLSDEEVRVPKPKWIRGTEIYEDSVL